MTLEEMLKEFHGKYGHLISPKPTLDIPYTAKLLRLSLIREEGEELITAMGFYKDLDGQYVYRDNLQNLSEIADGIADLIYVLVGTAITYGIPFDRIFKEVHNSNMTKTPIKVEGNEKYGTKTPKGPDFIAPEIALILSGANIPTRLEVKEFQKSYEVK